MQKIEVTYLQLVLIGLAVGFILGLIPLILGFFKKKLKLGLIGFVASIIAGAISSLLSIVTVGVFIWLIFKNSKKSVSEEVTVNENPVEVSIDNLDKN